MSTVETARTHDGSGKLVLPPDAALIEVFRNWDLGPTTTEIGVAWKTAGRLSCKDVRVCTKTCTKRLRLVMRRMQGLSKIYESRGID